ncbi:zinc finger protein 469 [Salmo salar]|uniref:Zinc finger protein 469 n=1 Tax=Salmo salar TaxID=8030 RepID=A0A1S3MKV2_SALSA|nr:zinc finger protein 469 [Salmo salar]
MAGETQHTYAVKKLDAEFKLQDEGTALEQYSSNEKATKESSEHFSSSDLEERTISRGAKFVDKDRDYTQQREAVIRPQQAGKIDFKSLQNKPKFASNRTWPSGKSSPQSPSGKNRSRDKGKRSGKSERGNPQQLYRLSIINPRSNPTIGIAYPQQKVSPPKKLEASRGPVSGSYRFHVPSIPEREAELQQEELNYSRCFQETSSNLTSPSYTSQALGTTGGTSTHQQPPQQQQQPGPMENNNNTQPSGQLLFPDFQLSGSNDWQSPERTFNGSNYGISSQKSTVLSEVNKANVSFLPFQYGYLLLEDSNPDPFPCDQNPQSQDYIDSSLTPAQVTLNSFTFQTSVEGQEGVQNNTQFNSDQRQDRSSYPHPPQPPQYLQAPQGATSSMHCTRGLSEDSASSESSGSISQQSDQGKSSLPDSTDTFVQADNRDVALTSGSKRSCHPKDSAAASQRTHIQASVHHARNIAQGPNSQMHFSNKAYNSSPRLNSIHMGSVPFDKSVNTKPHSRLPHSWEGPNKTFSPADQNTMAYPNMNDKFQNQPAVDQRPNTSKSSRMPWQQIRLTSVMPNQNRTELSRQQSNQKLTFLVAPSDWQDDTKSHKNGSLKSPSSFQNNRPSEGLSNPRQESVKQGCSTIPHFKVETSHAQVCESKNKPIYFGMNQSVPGASSSTYGYPPLQVPPMGLMMVSPYDSPSPSPIHNPASSSTCSSLSPASTSPVNLSEDSQISKTGHPPPFYHQHQLKAQGPTDHLSTNSHHFHSDASRNLPYAPEREKDDMMSYLQNNEHQKPSMEGNKGYMEGFGVEHHPPPPPYSAHQLLATSLATANLDQLDVLLTCKQCDQNFTNLASFLGHKQYCGQHAFSQKVDDTRTTPGSSTQFHNDMTKDSSSGTSLCQRVSMPRCPTDLHLSLLGLNKNGELMSDSETKGDSKDDPMKLNLFTGAGNLPVSLPDLEMEDAKLDSLITEALNGLGYQSDNAEIDSSFIDAFADDDPTTVKVSSNRQTLTTKDSMVFEGKSKQSTENDRSLTQGKYLYDSDKASLQTDNNNHTESKLEKTTLNFEQDEKINIKKELSHINSRIASGEKQREQENKVKDIRKLCKSEKENTNTPRFLLSSTFSERCGVRRLRDSSLLSGSTSSQVSSANRSSPTPRIAARENKRKRTGAGTWSKELIHKIVQQKNKLHKLHVKGTKNLQFSLVMERLTPTVPNPTFGEYDYVSDSDDESEPVKIASQGRLSQSSRCKYTYTKECKWRARSDRDSAAWRHESKECFELKKAEDVSLSLEKPGSHQRLRRRGSRSSTSSEVSTSVSISSDGINSPKSTDRTDSDCEKRVEIRRKDSSEQRTYERSPQKLCKESSTQLALTFTKSTQRYSTDKTFLSTNKDTSMALSITNSNIEDVDPVSGLLKVGSAVKTLEKCRSTDVSQREKDDSFSRQTETKASSDKNAPLRTAVKISKGESINFQSISSDLKSHQLQSAHPATNNMEAHSYNKFKKDETISKEKSVHKRRESVGCQSIQPHSKLSDISMFDKHNESVYPMKDPMTFTNDLVPKSTPLCSALMDEVCLSPIELQEPLPQKDTSDLIPYPLEQDQSLMKSPLSFDTSSMFGDLSVAGFENGLYTDIPMHKEGFNSLNTTNDKKEVFSSSSFLSPFLDQRDWGLMVDVSPMLPDEISQYKDGSDKLNEKKSDYNHVPLSLPDKIIDYSTNLNSCVSEDELEIKRIVTELENQLQTAKLSPPLLTEESPKQLKMSKFSPLRLDDESENEDTGLDMCCPVQSMALAVSIMPSDPHSESFAEHSLPWSSPFEFELMEGQHTPTHDEPIVLEQFSKKDDREHSMTTTTSNTEKVKEQLKQEDHRDEDMDVDKRTDIEKSEEILESKAYAENLMKSLEVISDSILKNDPITPEEEEPILTSRKSPAHLHSESQTPSADAAESRDHNEMVIPDEANIKSTHFKSQPPLSEKTELPSDVKEIVSLQPTESLHNNDSGSEFKDIPIMSNVTEDNSVIETDYCSKTEMDNQPMAEETCENQKLEDYGDEILEAKSALPDHTERLDTTIDEHTVLLDTTIDEHTELLDTTIDEHTEPLDTTIDEHTELLDTTIDEHTELLDTTIDEHPGLLNTSIDEHTELLDASIDEHTELLDTTIDEHTELLDTTIVEHTELLDTTIDEHQEPVEDISLNAKSVSQPSNGSNLAEQEMDVNLDNKPEEVENASEEQSIYIQSNCKSVCPSPSANEQTEDSSTCVMKEDNIESKSAIQNEVLSHTVSLRCSPPVNDIANQSTHVFMETVAVKPCSPLLMETNTEHASHISPFSNIDSDDESTMLVIAECDSDLDSDAHMEHTPEDKETEMEPECEANHRQIETIPEVEYIQEKVPLHLMAFPQHSPCKDDLQMDERLDIIPEDAPPSSPVLPASPHTPVDNPNTQEQEHSQPITCNNIDTIPASIQSPKEENCDDINAKEALHIDDSLTITAEMEYSSVSPPQLDLGITDSKICSTEACIPSPLPLTIATEESEAMEALTKRVSVSLYDFKLSPLNYNYIPDEPPQLSQFDYTPISPANVDEEEPTIKQSPKDDCEPCDRSDDTTLTSDKRLCDIETEVPMSPDHTAKQSPPDESLNKSNIQNDIKCPSILLGLPSQSTAPSTGDLDICPAPLQTIDYLDLHVDLLKRVDPEALDIYKVPSELNTLAFIKDISDNQHTPKPLMICENEPTPLPSDQTESLTVEEGQCSVTHQQEEETTQKKIHLCEICSTCFRTVQGLKRHKAMKHLIRTERSPILENANHQGSLHSYQTSQSIETGNKDDLELLVPHTCLQTESNEFSENHCPETSNSSFVTKQGETNFILENITSETNMAVPADDIVQQMPPQFTKAKKIYKPRKNRNKEVNVKPDPFSDELLNILKTDILQAITPEFQTRVKQGCCKSPEKQDIINYLVNHKVTEQEEVPFTVTSNSGIEQMPMSPIEITNLAMDLTQSNNDTEEVKSTNLPEIINGVAEVSMEVSVSKDISREYDMSRENLYETKEACEQQTKDESNAKEILGEVAVKIEREKNSGPTDEVDNLSCFKSSLASPPSLSADLNAFLDDESTFSQLFPTRNEELKRKKFAKVYGKKNKKQKLSTDSPLVQGYPPPDLYLEKKDDYTENQIDQTFVNNQNDPCEYETISIDDAIMLNMCHNSTLKSDSKKLCSMKGDTTDHKDNHENGVDHGSDFLCQPESTIDKASLSWSASNDSVTDTVISSDPTSCKAEAPTPPCPLPIIASSAPYTGEPCATDNVSPFHSIDIPNLNTTFQLPEIQLFDSNKDIPLERPIGTDYAETRDTAKAKKLTERKGRKRQEGSVKIKDKQYKCKVCFTWFLTLGELNFHKLSHNPSPPPTCYMCVQRKFSSREQLRDHLREKHAKNKAGIWTCGMCLKEISDVWMYNEHLREHATQFARKGQSHSAILGSLPGSGMQESAVKNFITSIMQRRPSKASRESSKVFNKEKLAVVENTEQEVKTTEVAQPKVVKPKGNSEKVGKPSTLTPVEVLHNTEPVPKNVEMHPNCKDPSRDCHHCGKQFPKPFKLQRHLVVHNLNKIFLCHKCPVTYQEPHELKYHLKNEHEEVDELDSKHTTLYTCELCADVMHVIKKSFICSTCNYTFSKKEQFDRHMEKHLSGGNKIFKFRGVLRPIKTSPSKENDECELPANKKRKILTDSLQENSSDSGIASIASLHLNKSAEMPVLKLSVHTTEDSTQTSAGEYHTENYASVKTEDMAEDYSDMLVELEHCTFHLGSEGLSAATPKTEDIDPSPSPKLPVRDIGEADGKSFTEPCDVKEEHDPLESSIAEKERECFANAKQSTPESSIQTTTAEAEKKIQSGDSTASDEELYVSFRENLINSSITPDTHDIHHPPTKHKSSTIVMDQMREGELGQQTTSPHSHDNKQNDKTSTPKPRENTKHSSNNSPRAMELTPVHHTKITSQGPASNEDKDSARREQKKRKEMRTPHSLQRVSSSATWENLAADVKTKNKFRPSKCESPAVHRKSDDSSEYPVLSSVKEDVVSNKIVSKHKTSGSLGLQAKRSSLDNCTPRKAEMVHHINGDYKVKKGPLGRPLHYPVSKASALPMNNSLNKSRPKTGVRSMESHSYRTAESQNNLLSQLFGQKLTSFKIPLRKDTSEPIN